MSREIKILDVFYGNKCNLTCNFCDTRSDYLRKGNYDPSINDIKKGIDLANKVFNVQKWSILGGEPLLYLEKVEEIIAYIRKIEPNKVIFFPTNGSLLDKHMDTIVEMTKKYRLLVQICNHFVNFEDQTKSNKVKKNAEELAKKLKIQEADSSNQFWINIMDLNSGSKEWQSFVKRKNFDILVSNPNERAWITENYGVYYIESEEFKVIHQFNKYGKPKPFTDNDPEGSYWNNCPSVFCAILYNKKIYKCAALATLRNFLELHGSVEDNDWSSYLNYTPVDLESSTEETADYFGNTHYCHIKECAMCPNKHTIVKKTEKKVLPLYFKQNLKINYIGEE